MYNFILQGFRVLTLLLIMWCIEIALKYMDNTTMKLSGVKGEC